jgi:hypothetical protein
MKIIETIDKNYDAIEENTGIDSGILIFGNKVRKQIKEYNLYFKNLMRSFSMPKITSENDALTCLAYNRQAAELQNIPKNLINVVSIIQKEFGEMILMKHIRTPKQRTIYLVYTPSLDTNKAILCRHDLEIFIMENNGLEKHPTEK